MKSIKHYISKAIDDPKRILRKLDRILLRGRGKRWFEACEEKKLRKLEQYIAEYPEEYYEQQTKKLLSRGGVYGQQDFSVRDVLLAQFDGGEAVFYDIAVRVLAIEQYYGKNVVGYDLFNRMQYGIRGYGAFWAERLVKLVQSYEDHGYEERLPIDLDNNLKLMDGAGRLALALYHKKEFIQARVHKTSYKRNGNYYQFWELNFSVEEIKLIQDKAVELFENCKYSYIGVIWPSSFQLRDEITKEIESFINSGLFHPLQNAECKILKYKDIHFAKMDFEGFSRSMYYADGMTEDGIQWKNSIIAKCLPEGCNDYPVRIFYIDVLNPEVGKNEDYITARAYLIAKIKKVIRNRYKDKIVLYSFDNVMHISDNYNQTKFCDVAINIDRDLSGVFAELNKNVDYAILKYPGRQSADFPKSIYYYTDVDVLVTQADLKVAGNEVEQWLIRKYGNLYEGWVKVERIADDAEQIMVRVAIHGWSCFMIHIQTVAHFGMNEDFSRECLANRVLNDKKEVYVLPPKYDMFFRAAEFMKKQTKVWHREYISKHINEYEDKLADVAYSHDAESCRMIKELFTSVKEEKR